MELSLAMIFGPPIEDFNGEREGLVWFGLVCFDSEIVSGFFY